MTMRIRFEPDLDYQQAAIEAVCDLFQGQERFHSSFSVQVPMELAPGLSLPMTDRGYGNVLSLSESRLLENLQAVQRRQHLPPSEALGPLDDLQFTVEMETGTGKTYVYLRTMLELHQRYGFTKFVIVVPSIAIKEGVYKSLQMTEEHFRTHFGGLYYEYFLYDSAKLGQVRQFATASGIQIMVVTVGAINKKDINNLYKDTEKTGGDLPIDLIRRTHPVVIVDEPQSVEGTRVLNSQGSQALRRMEPLCTLRYSATHAHKHHMVYRLDAVDAYQRQLVKQIEVASIDFQTGHNAPYLKVIAIPGGRTGLPKAKVEIDIATSSDVRRTEMTVQDGDDLQHLTGRDIYAGMRIGEIRRARGDSWVELRSTAGERYLKVGDSIGGVDPLVVQRQMIQMTIRQHLEKEQRLRPLGIKVLSLFFVPEVAAYRQYSAEGVAQKGPLAQIFEEEYRRWVQHPDFVELFEGADLDADPSRVHEGYFAIDKKGAWADLAEDGAESNQTNRDNAGRAYELIMKEKEKLLSFETPLRFIFSHSALQEGWDNPNVFQICAMREFGTERRRRQTIGRGLRLCVDQTGNRVRGFAVNTLTVVATESYQAFADNLQHEIEKDTGVRFGVLESHDFAHLPGDADAESSAPLGLEASRELYQWLRSRHFVDANGRIQDALRGELRDGTLTVPPAFAAALPQIVELLTKRAGRIDIKDARERIAIPLNKEVYCGEEFQALWDRIKHRTTYRVHFNSDTLIRDCAQAIRDHLSTVSVPTMQEHRAILDIAESGVEAKKVRSGALRRLDQPVPELPDILTILQERTGLTRRSLAEILRLSGGMAVFILNPQEFLDRAVVLIKRCLSHTLVDGIRYQRLGEECYYAQELFEAAELTGYLTNLVQNTRRSVFQHVRYDSSVEREFVEQLEANDAIRVYAKLPPKFVIPTPLGPYNPDWAVVVATDAGERVYFVVETKSTDLTLDLRRTEADKIRCGKAHVAALQDQEHPPRFEHVVTVNELLARRFQE
ncbi:MAG: hypothetical protein GEEBNDBF_02447 [bacterium]|nr:hypothetical protein [bacterium]